MEVAATWTFAFPFAAEFLAGLFVRGLLVVVLASIDSRVRMRLFKKSCNSWNENQIPMLNWAERFRYVREDHFEVVCGLAC